MFLFEKKSLFEYDPKVGGLTSNNFRQVYQASVAEQSEMAAELGQSGAAVVHTYAKVDANGELLRNADGSLITHKQRLGALDDHLPIVRVEGVILSVQKIMMPTDSVVVDCILGRGEGLDPYALEMQLQEQREVTLKNDIQAQRVKLAESIQTNTDLSPAEKVKLMKEIFTDGYPQQVCGCKGGMEDGN